jgi:hypothetical protein
MHIRKGNLDITVWEAHENIKQTLFEAFSSENPDSIYCQISEKLGFGSDAAVRLSFMNYGNMQLVYLATIAGKTNVAALINQPHTPLGKVKDEFENLGKLVEIDPRFVVKPLAYFASKEKGHELYASEYITDALCVAVNNGHGVYDPLPYYHFETFSPKVSSAVNSAMISLLVNYYDTERKRGLAKTQISGDDFILTRGFDICDKSDLVSVQPNMKIIAARGFVEATLDEYLDIIKQEFLLGTNREDANVVNGKIKVNTRSKIPMASKDIEKGIELGLKLRQKYN